MTTTELPPAITGSRSISETPGEPNLPTAILFANPMGHTLSAPNFPDSHTTSETQICRAVGDSTSTGSQKMCVPQNRSAVRGPTLADPLLGLLADAVDDLEMVRVANENRLRTLTSDDEFGHGLSVENKQVAKLAAIVEALTAAEHQAILNLQKSMRGHPLGAWVKTQKGIGAKQAARLLAVIRDPYWNDLHDRPRTVSELWAYCGLHVLPGGHVDNDTQRMVAAGSNVHTSGQTRPVAHRRCAAGVAPKRQRGQKSNWNEDARKRVWLIAASCIKSDGPYRTVYDEAREKYAESVHPTDCVRCGPAGKPALAGSPLSLGHQHARAMRLMSKAILKDLWIEAKRIHEEMI